MKTHLHKPEPFYKKKQIIISAAFCAAVIAIIVYFFTRSPDPSNMTETQIRKFIGSEDFNSLSHEQRREFFDKARDKHVTEYFNTPKDQREKYLDKVIDDMKNAPRPTGMRPPGGPDPNMPRDPNMAARQAPTPADMRARREMRDPVKESSRREFMGALMMRARQRGIQMGHGGGPGGGGPGGPGGGGPF